MRNFKSFISEVKSPGWYTNLHRKQKGMFYRGEDPKTRRSGAGLGALGTGLYLTWEVGMAKAYAGLATKGSVVKFKVPSNLKIADAYGKDVMNAKKKMGIDGYSADPMYAKALTFELKRMGYDGVVSDKVAEGLVIFDHAVRKVKKMGTLNLDEGKGGAAAGKLELIRTNFAKAKQYVEKMYPDFDIEKEIPNFKKNYEYAQTLAKGGFAQRKDMPVIDNRDIKLLQKRLRSGAIDIARPFAKNDVPDDPFPQGLDKEMGKKWVSGGLAKNDGDAKDDIVDVKIKSVAVGNLKPIQSQIYFDKSIKNVAKHGAQGTKDFSASKSNFYVVSSDNRIIDGHHRFLSAVLVDPKIKVTALEIDLPIKDLLPLTLSYTDAIGNVRNK
jgi:hypothetical protein